MLKGSQASGKSFHDNKHHMEKLRQKLTQYNTTDNSIYKPDIFDITKKDDQQKLERLFEEQKIAYLINDLENQEKELQVIKNPETMLQATALHETFRDSADANIEGGRWVYYPWRKTLVHCLGPEQYQTVRLARNKDLITEKEQIAIKNARISIFGLNVGYSGAIACALGGVGSHFDLVDLDVLSLTNLNRFTAGICDIGINKAVIAARHMYELDPYLDITVHEKGLNMEGAEDFIREKKPDLVIEEMDALKLKILVRKVAKEQKIPVVMVTGNGSDIILDVERYDSETVELLNGLLDEKVREKIENKEGRFSFEEHIELARDFMGREWLTKRLWDSFTKVGKELAGIPQLGETTLLRGATLGRVVRNILTGEPVRSGRYVITLGDFTNQ